VEVLAQYLYGECLERLEQSEAVERFEQFERGSAYVSAAVERLERLDDTHLSSMGCGRPTPGYPPMTSE